MMGAVFAMQGIGQFAAAIIALIVTAGFRKSLESAKDVGHCTGVCQLAVDKMWRIIIGFGAIPACFALYYRLTIPETPRYTFDVVRDVIKADEDIRAYIKGKAEGHPDEIQRVTVMRNDSVEFLVPKASWADFVEHYWNWQNGKVLLGTAGSWFFLDVGKFSPPMSCSDQANSASVLRSRPQQLLDSGCYWLDWWQECLRILLSSGRGQHHPDRGGRHSGLLGHCCDG